MYNNTYERPRTQIEKCEHLARMKFENPIEKAQRERDERVYRFSRRGHRRAERRAPRVVKGEDAMGKTANYGLPKWEKSDFIKMDDVNAAFGKIDETLKANADAVAAKAEAEAVTAIAQTIASSKICRAKFGTYTGLSGQNHPNSVECGFCPAALVLFRADGGQKTTVIRGVTACSSGIIVNTLCCCAFVCIKFLVGGVINIFTEQVSVKPCEYAAFVFAGTPFNTL